MRGDVTACMSSSSSGLMGIVDMGFYLHISKDVSVGCIFGCLPVGFSGTMYFLYNRRLLFAMREDATHTSIEVGRHMNFPPGL